MTKSPLTLLLVYIFITCISLNFYKDVQIKSKKNGESGTEDKKEFIKEEPKEMIVKFDFQQWAQESNLTDKTVQILLILEALIMLHEDDVRGLELTVGQQKLLSKGINVAHNQ